MTTKGSEQSQLRREWIWSAPISDFIEALDSYDPTFPSECVQYFMEKSGINVKDDRVVKLVALAADKFLVDTIVEAKNIGKLRGQKRIGKRKFVDSSETLNMEDVVKSLQQQKIHVMRKAGTLMISEPIAELDQQLPT